MSKNVFRKRSVKQIVQRMFFFTIDITSNPVELNSGVAYKEMKNYDAALKELKTALSYSPYNNRTYNNLGAGLFRS
jgi:tetratricopeptide (TPR) repeat protein